MDPGGALLEEKETRTAPFFIFLLLLILAMASIYSELRAQLTKVRSLSNFMKSIKIPTMLGWVINFKLLFPFSHTYETNTSYPKKFPRIQEFILDRS